METAAEKRKRLRAAIDRAKANPNASDKGPEGGKAVEAAKRASKKRMKKKEEAKYRSKKSRTPGSTGSGATGRSRMDAEIKRQTQ